MLRPYRARVRGRLFSISGGEYCPSWKGGQPRSGRGSLTRHVKIDFLRKAVCFALVVDYGVADIRNLLLRFAGCCVLKTANKRQAVGRIFLRGDQRARQFAAPFDLKAAADPLDLSFKFAEVSQYPNFSDVKAGIRWIDSNPQFLFLRHAPSNRTQLFLAQRAILGICDG